MNKENCALKLVDEIILYYDAWSKKKIKLTAVVKLYHSTFFYTSDDAYRKTERAYVTISCVPRI